MSNEKQRNRPASRQLQDKVGGVAPAGLSPDGNETWRWLPFWCARWEWLSAALLKLSANTPIQWNDALKLHQDKGRIQASKNRETERMLAQAGQGRSGSAHVVVLGNEKGGSGKSTAALHIAIALLKAGQRVATIDLDCRQQSFTRYINNRSTWSRRTGVNLELPVHSCIKLGETMQIADNENAEYQQFADAIHAVERTFDFIVIDTPGTDSYLMRLAHSMADTLVTPVNDSFLDLDVLGTVDPATSAVTGVSHYAELVRDTRRKRRQLDGATTDWVVVRNRLSMLGSRNKHLLAESLSELSSQLGFRTIDGFVERAAYREFFPQGLTALDDLDDATPGARPNPGHAAAREEVTNLLRQLKLPLDERGRRRAANRIQWFSQVNKPLEVHDILDA